MIRALISMIGRDDDLLRVALDYRDIVIRQRAVIDQKDRHIARLELEHTRWARDLLHNFLIALETPDDEDLREHLWAAARDMDDQVARLEEHATA